MPYHAIVQRVVRSSWNKLDGGDLEAPWRLAAEDLEFTFGGDTVLSGTWVGRDHLLAWLRSFRARYDDLHFVVQEVAVSGWPWNTTVAARIVIRGRWKDGAAYENQATQWATLRWGKMTRDLILEDTKVLADALAANPARASG